MDSSRSARVWPSRLLRGPLTPFGGTASAASAFEGIGECSTMIKFLFEGRFSVFLLLPPPPPPPPLLLRLQNGITICSFQIFKNPNNLQIPFPFRLLTVGVHLHGCFERAFTHTLPRTHLCLTTRTGTLASGLLPSPANIVGIFPRRYAHFIPFVRQ